MASSLSRPTVGSRDRMPSLPALIAGGSVLAILASSVLAVATGSDWTAGPLTLGDCLIAVGMLTVPGWCLETALFPRGTGLGRDLDIALIPALSIASLTLGGLGIALLGLQLSAARWTGWIGLVSGSSLLLATARGWRLPSLSAGLPGPGPWALVPRSWPVGPSGNHRGLGVAGVALLVTAVMAMVLSFGVAAWSAAAQPQPGYTQLWLTRDANGRSLDVGIANGEATSADYSLAVTANGRSIAHWADLPLVPHGTWSSQIDVSQGSAVVYKATLFLLSDPGKPYRTVTLAGSTKPAGMTFSPQPIALSPTADTSPASFALTSSPTSGASATATSGSRLRSTAPSPAGSARPLSSGVPLPSLPIIPLPTPIPITPPAPTPAGPTLPPVPVATLVPIPLPTAVPTLAPTLPPTLPPAPLPTPIPLPVLTPATASPT